MSSLTLRRVITACAFLSGMLLIYVNETIRVTRRLRCPTNIPGLPKRLTLLTVRGRFQLAPPLRCISARHASTGKRQCDWMCVIMGPAHIIYHLSSLLSCLKTKRSTCDASTRGHRASAEAPEACFESSQLSMQSSEALHT